MSASELKKWMDQAEFNFPDEKLPSLLKALDIAELVSADLVLSSGECSQRHLLELVKMLESLQRQVIT